ncbi:PE-PGRS family protein PE_PGRS30-like [Palaemon carinicauda]|uniref:PE-PGRS family protein PE_PGRS30-like n=1 Tax=Palaemon carinicauda TaxID=392227 RepID=UPI0035B60D1B
MKVTWVLWMTSVWVSTNAGPVPQFGAKEIATHLPAGHHVTSIQPATPAGRVLSSISDTTQPINLAGVLQEITGAGTTAFSTNTVHPTAASFGHSTSSIPSINSLHVNNQNTQGILISDDDNRFSLESSGEFDHDDFDHDDLRIVNSGNSFIQQGVGGNVPLSAFISNGDVSGFSGVGGSVGGNGGHVGGGGGSLNFGGAPATVGTPLPNFGGAGGFGGGDFGANGGFSGGDVSFGGTSGPLITPVPAFTTTAGHFGGGGVTLGSVNGGFNGAQVTHGGIIGGFNGVTHEVVNGGFNGVGVTNGIINGGFDGVGVTNGVINGGFDGVGVTHGVINGGFEGIGVTHGGINDFGGSSVNFGGVGRDFSSFGVPLNVNGGLGGAGVVLGGDFNGAGVTLGSIDGGFGNSNVNFGDFGGDFAGVGVPLGGDGLQFGGVSGGHSGAITTLTPAFVSGASGISIGGSEIFQGQPDFISFGGDGQVLGGLSGVLDDSGEIHSSIGLGLGPQTIVTHEPVVTSIAAPTAGYLPPQSTIITSPPVHTGGDILRQSTFVSPPTETIVSVGPTQSVETAPITAKVSTVTSAVSNLLPTKSIDTSTKTVISAPQAPVLTKPVLPQLPLKTFSTNGLGTLLGSLSSKIINPGQTLGSLLRGLDGQDGIVVVDLKSQNTAGTRVAVDNDDLDDFHLDIDSIEDDTVSLSLGGSKLSTDTGVSLDTVGLSLGGTDTASVSSLDTTTSSDFLSSTKAALGPKFLFQTPLVDILSTKGRWLGTLIGGLVDIGDAVARNFNKDKLF